MDENQLVKYGQWAAELASEVRVPATDRQRHFVAVSRGEVQAESDFEFLWLRYKATVEADRTISRLTDELGKSKREIEYLSGLVKKLQATLSVYEKKLGLTVTEPKDPMDKYSTSSNDWREQP